MGDVRKKRWIVAGSPLLAAVAIIPALAQEKPGPAPLPEPARAAIERSEETHHAEAPLKSELPTTLPAMGPPRPPGPIARWRQRCVDRCRDAYWGYPEEFQDAPLGAAVAVNASIQAARGRSIRRVLYRYDFLPSSDQLKPCGKAQLEKIVGGAPYCSGPLFIEPTPGQPYLDEARRLAVWEQLQFGRFAFPSEWIVIGSPGPRGLYGAEALLVDRSLLQQTSTRGMAAGGGGRVLGNTQSGMGSSSMGMGGMSSGMTGGLGGGF